MIPLPVVPSAGGPGQQSALGRRASERHAARRAAEARHDALVSLKSRLVHQRLLDAGVDPRGVGNCAAWLLVHCPSPSSDQAFLGLLAECRQFQAECAEAALANAHVRALLASGQRREGDIRSSPDLVVDTEHTTVAGPIAESVRTLRHKKWGRILELRPIEPDRRVLPWTVALEYKESNPYNRRFLQRRDLKALLKKRGLQSWVNRALRLTQEKFLAELSAAAGTAGLIELRTGADPVRFWRLAKGREFDQALAERSGRLVPLELRLFAEEEEPGTPLPQPEPRKPRRKPPGGLDLATPLWENLP